MSSNVREHSTDLESQRGMQDTDSTDSTLKINDLSCKTADKSVFDVSPLLNATSVPNGLDAHPRTKTKIVEEDVSPFSDTENVAIEHSRPSIPVRVATKISKDNLGTPIVIHNNTRQSKDPPSDHAIPNAPSLISRRPSWIGTDDMPALGHISRGSFCDVKTFTSGKVLHLLSSCRLPSMEKKSFKQFLNVEDENLKYCRYLRSASPKGEVDEDKNEDLSLSVPLKYRPSRKIIVGHTKVTFS